MAVFGLQMAVFGLLGTTWGTPLSPLYYLGYTLPPSLYAVAHGARGVQGPIATLNGASVKSVISGSLNYGSRIPDAGCRMRDAGCRMRDAVGCG